MIGLEICELKLLLEKVAEKLQDVSMDAINLGFQDKYWDLPRGQAYDVSRPPELAVRSLQDDIVDLKRFLANSSGRTTTSEDVDKIISVLKAIAHLYHTPPPMGPSESDWGA